MDQKKYSYESGDIKVIYDVKRCIHAKECVKGLSSVFDPNERPWIQPKKAPVEKIKSTVERCPTGALHYEMKDQTVEEQIPPINTISISPDGPVYFRGDIEVQDENGNAILQDTRWALCRCGQSGNKPACDNSHTEVGFEAPAAFDKSSLGEGNSEEKYSKLVLKALKDGPLLVQGRYQMYSVSSQPVSCSKNIALCRCGGSENKPFCDGTHKKIDFRS